MVADADGIAAPVKVAVLDDYQGVARRYGPWLDLGHAVEVMVFNDHVADEEILVDRLVGFPVVSVACAA